MGGYKRVPGAAVQGFTLGKLGCKYDRVCLVCPDVARLPDAVALLGRCFDRLVNIDWIVHDFYISTAKSRSRYSKFSKYLFTYLRLLDPSVLPYGKILFLEDDVLPLTCLDDLFELQTPACVFNNTKSTRWIKCDNPDIRFCIHDYYDDLRNGSVIPRDAIEKGLTKWGFVGTANTMLLSPATAAFEKGLKVLESPKPYGYPATFSHPCEQIFYDVFDGDWYSIAPNYTTFAGHQKETEARYGPSKAIHYFSQKPWLSREVMWDDEKLYWKRADQMKAEVVKE